MNASRRGDDDPVVLELADALGIPAGAVRNHLRVLDRRGLVAVKGASMHGGSTWARTTPPEENR